MTAADWMGNFDELASVLLRLAVAFVLALPLGWERELTVHSPGLRTFPLVSIGACAYVLLGRDGGGMGPELMGRILQGLLTGIGFIAGGAILKGRHAVSGVSTAASLWNTAAVGAAVGLGHYGLAAALSVTNLLTLHFLRLKKAAGPR